MGIKFSVGVSDGHEDREQLEELRRRSPRAARDVQRGRGEKKREPKARGWPLQASGEDESIAGQSPWAW
jgi:hypothetical protein